jgi:hypothetical protein
MKIAVSVVVWILIGYFLGSLSQVNAEPSIEINPLVTVEQPFDEWINQDFKPVDPLTAYHAEDNSNWTGFNKFWFASAIGGQTADIISTKNATNRGCSESNPIYGDDPSAGIMILVKAGIIGISLAATEYWLDGDPNQQTTRNWVYGVLAISGFGAAAWNYSQNCE